MTVEQVHLFPVRHHSPRSSAVLRQFLNHHHPEVVLVEGPLDATSLIEVLVDQETTPPVAILGFRSDGPPASSLWPFAAYSPELVALRWAAAHQVRTAFIDIPVGCALALHDERAEATEPSRDQGDGPPRGDAGVERAPDLSESCATALGFRSFEEFWEASFEAPAYDHAVFRSAMLSYADMVRSEGNRAVDLARDAFMAEQIRQFVDSGVAPERIVAVLGAAHAAALTRGDVDTERLKTLPEAVPSSVTIIPFSFPRLASQLGYGAGNRAPQYYQRAHDAGCDYRRASLEVLLEFSEHLRLRGFVSSLADTIEAYRLAVVLAQIRGKAEPGLDEVRESAIATLCRGESAHVDGFLWGSVIGKNVGRVASRIGQNSLQDEFWREVRARRLPSTDTPESFVLRLNNEVEVATSTFLHRLRVAAIPYAGFLGSRAGASSGAADAEEVGGHAALSRVREAWEAQWTPATDVALVEKIVFGNTLQEVATQVLQQGLTAAATTGAAADVLIESVVAGCPLTVAAALRACETFASVDDDLPSLARGCRALSGLVAYGSSRALSELGDDVIPSLCQRTFARAVLRIRDASAGTDEAVAPVRDALRTLHEVALSQPVVDCDAWLFAARALVDSYVVNPTVSGLACGLLYLAQAIDDAAVSSVVGQRLSNQLEPEAAASFLAGFLEVNALVLVKSRPVVEALDGYLNRLEPERFRDVLPVLRRAFSALGATERRYLLENLLLLRRIGEQAGAARAVLDERDKEKLKAIGNDLVSVLDDLDDLL